METGEELADFIGLGVSLLLADHVDRLRKELGRVSRGLVEPYV
jgi:hypothetical protein